MYFPEFHEQKSHQTGKHSDVWLISAASKEVSISQQQNLILELSVYYGIILYTAWIVQGNIPFSALNEVSFLTRPAIQGVPIGTWRLYTEILLKI